MTYKPWKGFTFIGLGMLVDVILQIHLGRGHGPAGIPTLVSFFISWGWSQS